MMSRVSFDSTNNPLDELLGQAHPGHLQLPDLQRSWAWRDDSLRARRTGIAPGDQVLGAVREQVPVREQVG